MTSPAPARLERAFAPLIVFALVAGLVSVGLDIWQDLSGFGAGVLPLAGLGPAVGALAGWAAGRGTLRDLMPAPVGQRQVVAHLVLGLVASAVLVGLLFAGVALAGVDWPTTDATPDAIPFGITIGGVIVAAALQELGIRGFAQPILELTGSRLFATVLIGLVWGFWVVQLFPMQNTALTVGAVVLAVAAFAVLLGYLGNGSVGQRLGVAILVHAIVASALTVVTGGGVVTQPVALAFLAASVVTTLVFMAMFVVAQRRRAARRLAANDDAAAQL
ncbi:CPBP family glutamic-type intramembrane protease [Salinibacterium sp. SYSU T00001]|uniref:CPBP family glutamic-type intramembrane protease n=1 Tax=Homoserinimonas sedimenticola TaxID=2986805 RepID=UPI002236238F|nr:CPBP family glutamic-type intramembrane protease [Salinibacterium sedimenticola]MCW4386260.1 CPBP family glutamic-type intramembrane protease [Salinibacterium sedimenticola]